MDRRRFVGMFLAGSVGLAAAEKLGFLEELKNWVLSPKKTIFIPPEPKIWVWGDPIDVNFPSVTGMVNYMFCFDETSPEWVQLGKIENIVLNVKGKWAPEQKLWGNAKQGIIKQGIE